MTDADVEVEGEGDDEEYLVEEPPEEPLTGPDGVLHCVGGRDAHVGHWLAKLGVEPEGSGLMFGEKCTLAILHPDTGVWLTHAQIAKAAAASKLKAV